MKKILIELYNEMEENKLKRITKVQNGKIITMKEKRNGVSLRIDNEHLFFSNRMRWSWKLMYDQYIRDKNDNFKKM